jgi:hypothetical protein
MGWSFRRWLTKPLENDVVRALTKVQESLKTDIQEVDKKAVSQDKMYARSNQIKHNDVIKRLGAIEHVFADQLKDHHDLIRQQEIKAAEDAHKAAK